MEQVQQGQQQLAKPAQIHVQLLHLDHDSHRSPFPYGMPEQPGVLERTPEFQSLAATNSQGRDPATAG